MRPASSAVTAPSSRARCQASLKQSRVVLTALRSVASIRPRQTTTSPRNMKISRPISGVYQSLHDIPNLPAARATLRPRRIGRGAARHAGRRMQSARLAPPRASIVCTHWRRAFRRSCCLARITARVRTSPKVWRSVSSAKLARIAMAVPERLMSADEALPTA